MKQKKNRKGLAKDIMYCPYCGGRTELRSADGIYHDNRDGTMLYVCKNYPRCDTYVRVRPGTMEPIGTLANGRLRAIERKLRQVEALPTEESKKMLTLNDFTDDED